MSDSQKELYRSIFNSAPALLLVLDPSARVIRCNRRGNDVLGYSPEDLTGKSLQEIIHKDYRSKVKEKLDRLEGFAYPYDSYAELVDSEGEKIRGNLKLSELKSNGSNGNHVILLFEEIAELQLEDMEIKLERLRKKNENLEELTSVISHDLREPIRSMASYIDILLDRESDVLVEKSRERLKSIKKSAFRIEKLMDELSRISNPDSGQSLQLVDVPKTVRGITEELSSSGKSFEIEIQDEYPRVHFGPESMETLLKNLISNSIKFNEQPKKVKVGYELAEPSSDLKLFVRDNGHGVSQDYQSKIFETFEVLEVSNEEEKTGVGLAVSKRIVEENGGEIWMESEKGVGTTVYFTVPVYENQDRQKTSVPQLNLFPESESGPHGDVTELVDAATGLHNRHYFNQKLSGHLKSYCKNGHELKLMLVKPTNFQAAKDRYDEVTLKNTVNKLTALFKNSVRQSDIVIRFSETQFLFALPGMASEVGNIKERINAQLSELEDGSNIPGELLNLSFGSTLLKAGEEPDLEEALKEAERKLY